MLGYMDEAERCHALAYIAYGKLLTHGTAAQVVQEAGLSTWLVQGPELIELARTLRSLPGVEMVVPFGNALHISGRDAALLESTIAGLRDRPGLAFQRSAPGLEDVFIHLMRNVADQPSDSRAAA